MRGTTPGFGTRHPDMARLLAAHPPAATDEVAWMDGALPLRVGAHLGPADLPDELVTSVRCVVRVGELVVFCENVDGGHVLPGGRRESGETHADTASREVHEETGWLLEPESLLPLGWLHFEHLAPRRPEYLYPYPDFLQVVFQGVATERAGGSDWVDTDGYELSSRLVSVAEARQKSLNGPLATTFLDLL
ncbi:NUDIX domain-containing protein [Streptomyces sp. ID05-26A]|nr:NUDIX domain-containing protein [Streptomyces sp. ID05-26A]